MEESDYQLVNNQRRGRIKEIPSSESEKEKSQLQDASDLEDVIVPLNGDEAEEMKEDLARLVEVF